MSEAYQRRVAEISELTALSGMLRDRCDTMAVAIVHCGGTQDPKVNRLAKQIVGDPEAMKRWTKANGRKTKKSKSSHEKKESKRGFTNLSKYLK